MYFMSYKSRHCKSRSDLCNKCACAILYFYGIDNVILRSLFKDTINDYVVLNTLNNADDIYNSLDVSGNNIAECKYYTNNTFKGILGKNENNFTILHVNLVSTTKT